MITMGRSFIESFIASIVCVSFVLLSLHITSAQVRTSSNYQIQSDSINVGGGLSSSTNFVQESTVGEVATGESTSTTYALKAGYQQMQEVFISMSAPSDIVMDPDLPGLTGGTSNGSTTVTVTTDDPAGYSLTIESENSPAMQSGLGTIADYNEGSEPDYTFTTIATDAHFGFSPSGVDLVQRFLNDGGSACDSGSSDDLLACWAGLDTSAIEIARGSGSNHPDGATTTVYFRVGIGSSAGVISGLYTATTTLTALAL